MEIKAIENDFKEKVCKEIELKQEGVDRYVVSTPFTFEDGDELVIVFRKQGNRWILTDEGHTFMHLSYFLDVDDLKEGNRKSIVDATLSMFAVKNEDGELILDIPKSEYGDALFSFIEAIIKISDTTYLSRELVKSTFLQDLEKLMVETVPDNKLRANWFDIRTDPKQNYVVDYKIETKKEPLFVFALNNEAKVNVATITLLHFKMLKVDFRAIGIFEEYEGLNSKVAGRFLDVADKPFISLKGKEPEIASYIVKEMNR